MTWLSVISFYPGAKTKRRENEHRYKGIELEEQNLASNG